MRPNDDSLVMTASLGGTAALLEGDAERAVEQRIAREHPEAQLLKVAHHGSASGTNTRAAGGGASAVRPSSRWERGTRTGIPGAKFCSACSVPE